jgi:GAF domain-containing protein
MILAAEATQEATGAPGDSARELAASVASQLRECFEAEFALWDGATGEVIYRSTGPKCDELALSALVRVVADSDTAQAVAEAGSILVVAVPIIVDEGTTWVATAPFVGGPLADHDLPDAARLLGMTSDELQAWCAAQPIWPAHALLKFARVVKDRLQSERNEQRLSKEVELISENLASTYEEISLLYAVTQNLRISSTDEELGRLAIEWLGECVPAKAFAILYLSVGETADDTYKSRSRPRFITSGDCPVNEDEFLRLVESLKIDSAAGPHLYNERVTAAESWQFPGIRQLIAVPLVEGANVFGWIAVFNHTDDESFGTVEANLIGSLGTLLGIHSGNRELYRQQSELLADIVRALVSAIDAKDPYTSGHSDRVARFAVRIAQELRCGPKFINTIYMAGLLHDIGKIGIDDNVLRKAGRLTDMEFEHIKKHPELGYRILADLKPLADVLPAVLHHHEQWNGRGYPLGLSRTDIPLIARILAVADAYDAMTSDRPYRNGMADEEVYKIFREGAGQHWDPDVLDAFFQAKDEIRRIGQHERSQVDSLRQQLM